MDNLFDICIDEAKKALLHDDIPMGALIVKDNKIIAKAHNTREVNKNILEHAEINAILFSSRKLNTWNLSDCDLYVTLEPCSMCKEVIKQSRIKNVYFLLKKLDYKKEYNKNEIIYPNQENLKENEEKYAEMLTEFFKSKG